MKKLILFMVIIAGAMFTTAQNVSYEVLRDEPENHGEYYVNLTFADLGIDLNQLTYSVGVSGGYEILRDELYAELDFKKSLGALALGAKKQSAFELNLGASFLLKTTNDLKNRKFVLKSSNTISRKNQRITSTTFINIPYKIQKNYGVRAGFTTKTGAVGDEYELNNSISADDKFFVKHSQSGLYLGGVYKVRRNTVLKTDSYGRVGVPKTIDIYADILIIAVQRNTNFDTFDDDLPTFGNLDDYVKETHSDAGSIGIRFGMKVYTEVGKDAVSGKKLPITYEFEVGKRPYFGFYGNIGFGLTVARN